MSKAAYRPNANLHEHTIVASYCNHCDGAGRRSNIARASQAHDRECGTLFTVTGRAGSMVSCLCRNGHEWRQALLANLADRLRDRFQCPHRRYPRSAGARQSGGSRGLGVSARRGAGAPYPALVTCPTVAHWIQTANNVCLRGVTGALGLSSDRCADLVQEPGTRPAVLRTQCQHTHKPRSIALVKQRVQGLRWINLGRP